MAERIEVMRGTHKDLSYLLGPLPGYRIGDVLAYEFELPERFKPWPGRTRLERTFVLLDVGVSFAQPCWERMLKPDGTLVELDPHGDGFWYVDLISVEQEGDRYLLRDLYIDVVIPNDSRQYRMLDLDEYADAMTDGTIALDVAIDGLRRWQRFLDRHLHDTPWPQHGWSDFPPRAIRELAALPAPFGTPVVAGE